MLALDRPSPRGRDHVYACIRRLISAQNNPDLWSTEIWALTLTQHRHKDRLFKVTTLIETVTLLDEAGLDDRVYYEVEVCGPVLTKTGVRHATQTDSQRFGHAMHRYGLTPLADLPPELAQLCLGMAGLRAWVNGFEG
jgi:hypothetical protein